MTNSEELPLVKLPEDYPRWWRQFRASSGEADTIADGVAPLIHEAVQSLRKPAWGLTDVGCGDGALTANVLRTLRETTGVTPAELTLIDPLPWISEAATRCREVLPDVPVKALQMDLHDFLKLSSASNRLTQVCMAVHSAYYIPLTDLEWLLSAYAGGDLVLVNDAAGSLFFDTWSAANTAMSERFTALHRWLSLHARVRDERSVDMLIRIPQSGKLSEWRRDADVYSFFALRDVLELSQLERERLLAGVLKHCDDSDSVRFAVSFDRVSNTNALNNDTRLLREAVDSRHVKRRRRTDLGGCSGFTDSPHGGSPSRGL